MQGDNLDSLVEALREPLSSEKSLNRLNKRA